MTLNNDQIQQILDEGITCIGCGSLFQTTNPDQAGYIKASKLHDYLAGLNSPDDPIDLLCERCFKLRHYNQIQPVALESGHFQKILSAIADKKALVLYLIDLFDVSGSMINGISRFIGNNPIVIVGNKADILPKSVKKHKLADWLQREAKKQGLQAVKTVILSADKGDAGETLLNEINDYLDNYPEIYVVGVTNVGKSTLINQIIKALSGSGSVITTSRFPGTTLDRIVIPLTEKTAIIDTPGIIHASQMTHIVSPKDYKYLLPNKEIKARTFQLQSGQTIFFGGLGWMDFLNRQNISITAYFENNLLLHRGKTEKSSDFFRLQAGKTLLPITESVMDWISQEIKILPGQDVAISGLGWVTFRNSTTIRLHLPKGVAFSVRQAEI
ncbi:MAG: ribosome biogenesis GTPase YqeH [Oenococcus sp.]|uniref:ribosome biogenesis GTPase YqeH n=1 Tax=Oenococcus sp. TaxID=1979414 RepID=UPI0039E7D80D